MKSLWVGATCLLFCFRLFSQPFFYPQAQFDFGAVFSNPSAVAFWEQPQVGITVNNSFLMKELCSQAFGLAFPKSYGCFTSTVEYSGFSAYQNLKIGGGYAKRFFQRWSVGLQFNYHWTGFGKIYGSHHGFSFDAGTFLVCSKALKLGFSVQNPAHFKLKNNGMAVYYYPLVFSLGMSYDFSKEVSLYFDIQKNIQRPFRFLPGMQWRFKSCLSLMFLLDIPTFEPYLEFSYEVKRIRFQTYAKYHPQLGASMQFSVSYKIKTRNKTKNEN